MGEILKGNRTYLVTITGFVTGLGVVLSALSTGDMTHVVEGALLMFTSAGQFFQRAATK